MTAAAPAREVSAELPRRGNAQPLRPRAERDKLVEENLGLIGYAIGKLMHVPDVASLPYEDAWQEGARGLIRAAELWDPEKKSPETGKGVRFCTYAVWAIRAHVLKAAQNQRVVRVPLGQQARLYKAGTPLTREFPLPVEGLDAEGRDHGPDARPTAAQVAAAEVEELLSILPIEERRVVALRWLDGRSTSEIALDLGISTAEVWGIQRRAMSQLRAFVQPGPPPVPLAPPPPPAALAPEPEPGGERAAAREHAGGWDAMLDRLAREHGTWTGEGSPEPAAEPVAEAPPAPTPAPRPEPARKPEPAPRPVQKELFDVSAFLQAARAARDAKRGVSSVGRRSQCLSAILG